mgnify:CR=1 FL=1
MDTRDAIDFASQPVGKLFRRMLGPTLLSMISIVILNFSDGAFIGNGAGAESLAAVNIAAPIFNLMAGLAIMFGIGGSVVVSIHLSRGHIKAARINMTQAVIGTVAVALLMAVFILSDLPRTCRLFGSSEALIPLASSYLKWIALSSPIVMLDIMLRFMVRLDGSPNYAMVCSVLASILNIVLDYVFIFPVGWGLEGAAIATSISFSLSGLAQVAYILFLSKTLRFYRLKMSLKSLWLTLRNIGYQMKMGFSVMLGEVALSGAVIVGNFIFIHYLGDAGVAAYSVACYCFPIIFMFANSIVQSAQPIVSFAHGRANSERLRQSKRLMLRWAVGAGAALSVAMYVLTPYLTRLFLSPAHEAYAICVEGFPYFITGVLFSSLNIVLIGYLQSVEQSALATIYTCLRGIVIVIPCFLLLPRWLGIVGIWLAIPLAEFITFIIIVINSQFIHRQTK